MVFKRFTQSKANGLPSDTDATITKANGDWWILYEGMGGGKPVARGDCPEGQGDNLMGSSQPIDQEPRTKMSRISAKAQLLSQLRDI